MPETDGFAAISELKSSDRPREIPIIFLTANTDEIERLHNGIVTVAADIVEGRDKATGGHIHRTAGYLRVMLE
jgi:CheY-like chemotaxis protein